VTALVSIVTRTLGRPCLADAAASVAAQTHRPLEWVVVDAAGRGLDLPSSRDVPVRLVSTGEPMLRARAANAGFDAARGERAIILDDDDLLRALCVERLSAALDAEPGHRVAYGNVSVVSGREPEPPPYAFEYSELLITRRNLFPPNGPLFDLSLCRDAGVRYDETLDWYEDWDFWLQASMHTRFLHVRETLADYRLVLSQSGVAAVDEPGADPRIREQRDIVIARVAPRRRALEARHDELKREAAAHAAAGRWREAAAGWAAAHQHYHYDAEPILRYGEIALRAGDLRAARAIVDSGLALLPAEPSLHRLHATLLQRQGDRDGAEAALERARRLAARGPVSPI
jgi:tetratricopeptide (TPR) repeat protein